MTVSPKRQARNVGPGRAGSPPGNSTVAERLDEAAQLLEEQEANPFRVRAYRQAAETIRHLDRPVTAILESEGLDGLDRLPGIGPGLARAIRDLATTGRFGMLERLRGEADPEGLLASVPGIGPVIAERLHREYEIDSLEELEAAVHEGRLAEAGLGAKRLGGIRLYLASRLARARPKQPEALPGEPAVDELLDVDREYRQKAKAGALKTIAPRRFNPSGAAWLPVLHTTRGERHYTALFSNTARAHELGRTRDWVVLYYDHDSGHGERQCTVITSRKGPFAGKRIVRGREAECAHLYSMKDIHPGFTGA
jgi:DNA polymerase (family 10)